MQVTCTLAGTTKATSPWSVSLTMAKSHRSRPRRCGATFTPMCRCARHGTRTRRTPILEPVLPPSITLPLSQLRSFVSSPLANRQNLYVAETDANGKMTKSWSMTGTGVQVGSPGHGPIVNRVQVDGVRAMLDRSHLAINPSLPPYRTGVPTASPHPLPYR